MRWEPGGVNSVIGLQDTRTSGVTHKLLPAGQPRRLSEGISDLRSFHLIISRSLIIFYNEL